MAAFVDQTGKTVFISTPPRRIISLVPSQTELLADLGLDEAVIGITKFCIHPEKWFRSKTRVGGTKTLDTARIHQLQPDLIIANKEENVKEQVEDLANSFPVWVSDVNDLEDALTMIREIGRITSTTETASKIIAGIRQSFSGLPLYASLRKAAYLIWKDPYMTVGNDTFIHSMLRAAGFENVFGDQTRYPVVDVPGIQRSGCEYLFLSSEPYPFKQKHIDELQLQLPGVKIMLVDGEMFSWYGSRLLYAAEYFRRLE
ncbi:helical backbone metal receptor [Terrimonas sp. NA20]|uniref:Helical backbone metal receptor n=1 Tax=Terrimonas ginsenosidimutans TaxID=2908004 RepID=A0ABS9KMU6_9BACT|nr:helical backbone metal receptor [Terrimonas ginsenosidimutans]MCG2613631.1 helical backbone metal receptor [Terrimonas ginsenosidimutans]